MYRKLIHACLIAAVAGHSWVERINTIIGGQVQLGTYGYPRGNVLRTAIGFRDGAMTHQLPIDGAMHSAVLPIDPICATPQRIPLQTLGSPRIKISTGDILALQYNENGHITKPWNNPLDRQSPGIVYVYGTNSSLATDALSEIHGVWSDNGTGGDGRGRRLANVSFDDGKCYQYTDENSGSSLIQTLRASERSQSQIEDAAQGLNRWCVTEVQLPWSDVGSMYTLYWVWDYGCQSALDVTNCARPQVYTTCIDVEVTENIGNDDQDPGWD